MDNSSPQPIEFALDMSKKLSQIVNAGTSSATIPCLQLSACIPGCYASSPDKRKKNLRVFNWDADCIQGSSLVLGLGPSYSSCTSIIYGKKTEDESSINLGLSINSQLGTDRMSGLKNTSSGTYQAFNVDGSKLDLELSLSTGLTELDVTTVTEGSTLFQINTEPLVIPGTLQLVDEGSTSSRWKLDQPIPSFRTTGSSNTANSQTNVVQVFPCLDLNTTASMPESPVACAFEVSHQQQRNTNVKSCHFQGCTRGARGASGLCIAHGGGRRCQRAGCQKGAEGKTVFCKSHGGGRRCQYLGCTKSAEGCTDYCIGHGGGRRCSHEGCGRASRGKSGLCIRHGGGKRCKIENCARSAEGISGLCISHGGGRRCQYPTCTKGAQGSTMFCKAHGGGKRCTYPCCTKGAEGSTTFCKGHGGGKRCSFSGGCTKSVHGGTLFCVNHGGGKRCSSAGCTKSARGRTNFCVRHGGGKRCKFEGCVKSAQGSTDFCKAHGGGKRCSWGQMGSMLGDSVSTPCDKFARAKSGLCAAHFALMHGGEMHDADISVSVMQNSQSSTNEKMKGTVVAGNCHSVETTAVGRGEMSVGVLSDAHKLKSMQIPTLEMRPIGSSYLDQFSLPEGRVHGGSLMAMLKGHNGGCNSSSTVIASTSKGHFNGQPSEPGISFSTSRGWL